MRSHFLEAVARYQDSIGKIAICFLNLSICILTSVDRAFILVFFASKQADRCLISVNRALILVFSASKKAFCFLKMPDRFLLSVIHALITIICL